MCSQKVGSTPGIECSHNKSSSFAHLDPETGCRRPCPLRHKCGKEKIKPPSQMKIWKLCCTTGDSDLLLSPLPRNSGHVLFRNPWPCYWNTCTFQIPSESAHILFPDLGSINWMILWGIIWGLRFLWLRYILHNSSATDAVGRNSLYVLHRRIFTEANRLRCEGCWKAHVWKEK